MKPSYIGLESFSYKLEGIDLECWIEFEEGEEPTRDEPGESPSATLWYAEHCGEDIAPLLSPKQVEQIEIAALQHTPEYSP
jgi:hypothetical protein